MGLLLPPRRIIGLASGTSTTAPDTVGTLWSWFDASQNAYSDYAGTTPASDGTTVKNWQPRAGTSSAAFRNNSTTTSQVVYHTTAGLGSNNVPAIEWIEDGTSFGKLKTDGNLAGWQNDFTVMCVLHSTQSGAQYGYMVSKDNPALGVYFEPEAYAQLGPGYYEGSHEIWATGASINRLGCWTASYASDNTSKLYEGGTQLGSTNTTAIAFSGTADQLVFGGGSGASPDAKVAHICIWSGELAEADIITTAAYFVADVGI